MKITSIQIASYIEKKELPTLQYLADQLRNDEDIEYVLSESKAISSLNQLDIKEYDSIYTKLKDYPYEFEINNSLQLASINGVKIASTPTTTLNISLYDLKSDSYKAWSSASHTLTLSSKVEKGKYIIILNGSRSNQSNSSITSGLITFEQKNAVQLYDKQYNDTITSSDGSQLLTISQAYFLEVEDTIDLETSFQANYAMNMNYLMTILKIEA